MHILLVTLFYAPDGGPAAPLFQMLSEQLVRRGHRVTVIASVPHYPSGQVRDEYRRGWIQSNKENGVNVIRVRVPSLDRNRLSNRLVQFLIYQIGATLAGLPQSYDVALVTNPAISNGLPFTALSTLRRKPAVYFIADVYPDVGVQLGIFRHSWVVKLVTAIEKFCLKHSKVVWVFSKSFIPRIRSFGIPSNRLALLYGWTDTDLVHPLPRCNEFAIQHGLEDKFVILYAGNLGLSQGLENILETASMLTKWPDIRFVFIGDGTGRNALMALIKQMRLDNVLLLPFQPRSRLPQVLAAADLCLVSLQPGMSSGSIPSKTFTYMASGRPILASVDPYSDVWDLVENSGAGICVPAGSVQKAYEAILCLYNNRDLSAKMGNAGRLRAEQYHTPYQAALQVEALLTRAINERNRDSI